MYPRTYLKLAKEYLQYFPCVAIIGPRQAGKTTILKAINQGERHFDLERAADFELISRDPDLFLRSFSSLELVTIDEAQLLPALFPALRVAIDGDRGKAGRFLISGSSSPELLASISESLAGRVGTIEISPLQFSEATRTEQAFAEILSKRPSSPSVFLKKLQVRGDIKAAYYYLLRGGYPEPNHKDQERFWELWHEQYISTYVERDIARLFPNLNQTRYKQFIQTLASMSGTVINVSEVGRAIDVSQPTAKDYFNIAHGTFLWRTIQSYQKNATKRLVKHPKGYLRDSGVLCHLLRVVDERILLTHPKIGEVWEGVVIEEIIRGLNSIGESFNYYYYRTSAGAEVDLILEGKFGLIPIEIKFSSMVKKRDLKNIEIFIEEHSLPYGIVLNNDTSVRMLSEKVIGIPFLAL